MSYKEIFESNNVDLQTILDKVNALPDAGEGGSAKSATVTIENPYKIRLRFDYYNSNGEALYVDSTEETLVIIDVSTPSYCMLLSKTGVDISVFGTGNVGGVSAGSNSHYFVNVKGDGNISINPSGNLGQ